MSVFKQIYFDEISGNLMILDTTDNYYQCNIYGEKKSEFLPNVTGYDASQRMDIKLNTNFKSSLYNPQKGIIL